MQIFNLFIFSLEKLLVYQAAFLFWCNKVKKAVQSYVSFTRTEKYGLIALCALILFFAVLRIALPYFIHNPVPTSEELRQKSAWEVYKRSQPDTYSKTGQTDSGMEYGSGRNADEMPGVININTADSETLVGLNGIGPVMAGKIMKFRREGGHFTKVGQLQNIQRIPDATFKALLPHLSATDSLP